MIKILFRKGEIEKLWTFIIKLVCNNEILYELILIIYKLTGSISLLLRGYLLKLTRIEASLFGSIKDGQKTLL